jgi:hypothetical protein
MAGAAITAAWACESTHEQHCGACESGSGGVLGTGAAGGSKESAPGAPGAEGGAASGGSGTGSAEQAHSGTSGQPTSSGGTGTEAGGGSAVGGALVASGGVSAGAFAGGSGGAPTSGGGASGLGGKPNSGGSSSGGMPSSGGGGSAGSAGASRDPILDQTCPASTETNACYRCEDIHCCNTYAACAASAECGAYKLCLQACTNGTPDTGDVAKNLPADQNCDLYCYNRHPGGLTLWAPRSACLEQYCYDTDACGTVPLNACQRCTNQLCAKPQANLSKTPDGQLLLACNAACGTGGVACLSACLSHYPAASGALDAFGSCVTSQCPVCD